MEENRHDETTRGLTIRVKAEGLDEIQEKVDRLAASLENANAALKELCGGAEIRIDLNAARGSLAEVEAKR